MLTVPSTNKENLVGLDFGKWFESRSVLHPLVVFPSLLLTGGNLFRKIAERPASEHARCSAANGESI